MSLCPAMTAQAHRSIGPANCHQLGKGWVAFGLLGVPHIAPRIESMIQADRLQLLPTSISVV
jgi:hypothetical protein